MRKLMLIVAGALAFATFTVAEPAGAVVPPSGYAIEFCVSNNSGHFFTAEVVKPLGKQLFLFHTGGPITPGEWASLPPRALSSSKPTVDAWIAARNVATVYHTGC